MKFSRYIQFNAVPEWSEYYLPYSELKTLVYQIETEKKASIDEYTALLPTNQQDHAIFIQALNSALNKIIQFYKQKENEATIELEHILSLARPSIYNKLDQRQLPSSTTTSSSIEIEDNQSFSTSITLDQNGMTDGVTTQLIELYIFLSKLKLFVSLNMTAFTKILKKYDKVMNASQSQNYMFYNLLESYPFQTHTRDHIDDLIQQVEQMYGTDKKDSQSELTLLLSDQLAQDRNTMWREKIAQERRLNSISTETHKLKNNLKTLFISFISLIVFIYLLNSSLFEQIEQRRCFAVLVFASILWATELMPLFVTALLVPFLVIVLRVIRSEEETDEGERTYIRLSAMDASKTVFASMLSPVIMLLLGGFTIAAALNKYGIAKALASFVLSKAGTRPSHVLLVNMLVASMASMWISNVAAPVLSLSLIQPILRNLPTGSTFGPCLIMGIALASNLGGIASPIASPQNVIAIQNMSPPPSWTDWFCVSIPLCVLGNCLVWLWLLKSYQIKDTDEIPNTPPKTSNTKRASWTQIYITFITLFTIILWCIAHTYRDTLGDMGVIAIVPLIGFFGTGLLTKDEFNNFLWNVIILAMGGIALGKAVDSSGLLHTIAIQISERVMGLSTFQVLFVFSSLVLVIATFISHTVAALIVLPIVAKIGTELTDPNPRLLVMGTAFVCSAAMGLPVSGFPNMTAISQENSVGLPYLKTIDFLRNGVPCSILIMLCIVSLGYVLMEFTGI
ncbi:SPX domain-containing protein [Pilaira anomala]|nr:SPX domain-containing protein [Pilaira anomala]